MWTIDIQKRGRLSKTLKVEDNEILSFIRKISRPRKGQYPQVVKAALAYGDALILSPALDALHAQFPDSPVHLVTTERGRLIFLHNPAVEVIISYDRESVGLSSQICRYYLHSHDLGRWLAETDALIENSYELSFKRLLLNPGPVKPRFYCIDEEEQRTLAELASCGIRPGENKIVLIQSESSAMMRRWPLEYVFSLTQALSAKGLTVIVAGSPRFLGDATPPDLPNVYYTCKQLQKLSVREGFLLTKYADVVCTVDSVYSHLALVYQRPTVLLYGTLRGELLSAPFFERAYVLQRDLPCGPCHQHQGKCIVAPQAYASPCMRAISPNIVLKAIDRLLAGQSPRRNLKPSVQRDNIEGECPICKEKSFEFRARKGDKFYLACSRCGTVYFSDMIPVPSKSSGFLASEGTGTSPARNTNPLHMAAIPHIGKIAKSFLNSRRPLRALIIDSIPQGINSLLPLQDVGWNCDLYDPQLDIFRTGGKIVPPSRKKEEGSNRFGHSQCYDAVFAIGCITRITRPEKFTHFIENMLRQGGLFVAQSPVADYCIRKEAKSLNTPEMGQNLFVPSIQGLNLLIDKNRSYDMVYNSRMWATDYQTMIWRKIFHNQEQSVPFQRISFCTTCMGRLHHLKTTLPQNIADNRDYPNIEFCVLDYDSPDGLEGWIRTEMREHLESGLLRYQKITGHEYFHISESKNLAHKMATGDILCNVDADNFTGDGFAFYINQATLRNPGIIGCVDRPFSGHPGLGGRIFMHRKDFDLLGGYDERFSGWGFEGTDLELRALIIGKHWHFIPRRFLTAIHHDDTERTRFMTESNIDRSYGINRIISLSSFPLCEEVQSNPHLVSNNSCDSDGMQPEDFIEHQAETTAC